MNSMTEKTRSLTIITTGSRGDVQPFIALALGLKAAGHKVRIVTHEEFRTAIEKCNLDFSPIAGDPKALIASEAGQQFFNPRSPVAFFQGAKRLNDEVAEMFQQQMRDGMIGASGSDALICSFSAPLSVYVAEKLGLPYVVVALAPIVRTRDFPAIIFAPRSFGPFLNSLTHRVFQFIVERLLQKNIKNIRKEHGLARKFGSLFSSLNAPDVLFLNAFSAKIVPPPNDWPIAHRLTGFLTVPSNSDYQPTAELKAFLNAGEPPVYVGFGSMVDKSPTQLTDIAVGAAKKSGKRLIISKGWANLASESLPGFVFALGDVPHEWLFPHLAGIVHHGGAGTTAAALRSGIPSTIVPFGVDQPFWGWRVSDVGVGCKPIPRKQLTVENLADAFIRMSSDQAMIKKASELGAELRREDGVLNAVRYIEAYLEARN